MQLQKKAEYPMEWNYQVNDSIMDLYRENGRAVSITRSYHLNARDIPIREQFQVTCGT